MGIAFGVVSVGICLVCQIFGYLVGRVVVSIIVIAGYVLLALSAVAYADDKGYGFIGPLIIAILVGLFLLWPLGFIVQFIIEANRWFIALWFILYLIPHFICGGD